jgi:hypothetical protein
MWKSHIDVFVLKIIFIKIYIYNFSIDIFIEKRSQSRVLETVSLSKMTSFIKPEGVYTFCKKFNKFDNLWMRIFFVYATTKKFEIKKLPLKFEMKFFVF